MNVRVRQLTKRKQGKMKGQGFSLGVLQFQQAEPRFMGEVGKNGYSIAGDLLTECTDSLVKIWQGSATAPVKLLKKGLANARLSSTFFLNF
ncbi:MAG: hypothetical protein ACM37W_06115 [Actinomycetota bacterium]